MGNRCLGKATDLHEGSSLPPPHLAMGYFSDVFWSKHPCIIMANPRTILPV